jgi:hypothetical protein
MQTSGVLIQSHDVRSELSACTPSYDGPDVSSRTVTNSDQQKTPLKSSEETWAMQRAFVDHICKDDFSEWITFH